MLFWNCQDEDIPIEVESEKFEFSSVPKIKAQAVLDAFLKKQQKSVGNSLKNKDDILEITPNWATFVQENLSFTDALLSAVDIEMNISTSFKTRIVFLTINEKIWRVIESKDIISSDGDNLKEGYVYYHNLDGKFIIGFKIENGLITKKLVKRTSVQKTSFLTMSRYFKDGCDENLVANNDFCKDNLNGFEMRFTRRNATKETTYWVIFESNGGSGGYGDSYGGDSSDGDSGGGSGGENPAETTCGNGYVYDAVLGTCVKEDKIINELKGKDLCIFNELKKLNLFKSTIGKFSNGNYNLTFTYSAKCNGQAGEVACTDPYDLVNGNITIKILESGNQSLDFAATLLHEGIHAEIYKYVDEHIKGIDPNNRKSVFHYYNYYSAQNNNRSETSIAQHQHMQDVFVIPIAKAIRQLDNYRLPLENYYGFGWEGLKEDYEYDNYIDINGKVQVMTPQKYRYYINKMYNVISTTKFKELLKNCS